MYPPGGKLLCFSSHLVHGLVTNRNPDLTRVALELRLHRVRSCYISPFWSLSCLLLSSFRALLFIKSLFVICICCIFCFVWFGDCYCNDLIESRPDSVVLNVASLASPFFDEEQIASSTRVLSSGKVNAGTGQETTAFEVEFAEWCGTDHASDGQWFFGAVCRILVCWSWTR